MPILILSEGNLRTEVETGDARKGPSTGSERHSQVNPGPLLVPLAQKHQSDP